MRNAMGVIYAECLAYSSAVIGADTRAFPRPLAKAEAAWTPKPSKDGLRFAAQIRLHPKL